MTPSDFLDSLNIQGRTWCYFEMTECGGITVPHNSAIIFHMVLSGSVMITTTGGGSVRLNAGEAAYLISGEAHALRVTPRAVVELCKFLAEDQAVDVPPAFRVGDQGKVQLRMLSGRLSPGWPENVSRSILPAMIVLGGRHNAAAEAAFLLGAFPAAGFGAGAAALLTRLAAATLVGAVRRDLFRRQRGEGAKDPIQRAIALIELKPGADWNVTELARNVGMGRSNFSAHFSQRVGRAPMEYVIEARMQKAAQLLRESRMKVADICETVGYSCEIAFTRRFVRHFGIAPLAMRNAAGHAAAEGEAVTPSFSLLRGKAPTSKIQDAKLSTQRHLPMRMLRLPRVR